MEASSTSETLANVYQATWHYNPEYRQLHIHCHENLRSYLIICVFHKRKSGEMYLDYVRFTFQMFPI